MNIARVILLLLVGCCTAADLAAQQFTRSLSPADSLEYYRNADRYLQGAKKQFDSNKYSLNNYGFTDTMAGITHNLRIGKDPLPICIVSLAAIRENPDSTLLFAGSHISEYLAPVLTLSGTVSSGISEYKSGDHFKFAYFGGYTVAQQYFTLRDSLVRSGWSINSLFGLDIRALGLEFLAARTPPPSSTLHLWPLFDYPNYGFEIYHHLDGSQAFHSVQNKTDSIRNPHFMR